MAEILVKLSERTDITPENEKAVWRKGMPVVVMDDGHSWGLEERPPKFFILKLPGIPKAKVEKFLEDYQVDTGLFDPDGLPLRRMEARRLWKIDIDNAPLALRSAIQRDGIVTVRAGTYLGSYDLTWLQLRNHFRNLRTGELAEIS